MENKLETGKTFQRYKSFHEVHRRPPGNFGHYWSDFVKGTKQDKVRKVQTGEFTRGGADKLDFI